MANDDTDGGSSTRRETTDGGVAVAAGLSGTDAAGVPTATAVAGGPAFDRRRVTRSDR
jgi:hypothetical protein